MLKLMRTRRYKRLEFSVFARVLKRPSQPSSDCPVSRDIAHTLCAKMPEVLRSRMPTSSSVLANRSISPYVSRATAEVRRGLLGPAWRESGGSIGAMLR